ncbi:uncharacterized protein FFNC_15420 [Fusarium fujikuroi]|nr:uncharacterized protein FFNC_15420 [Fusarium fujikuroi]
MSDSLDSTNPGGAAAASDARPKKLSLRDRDAARTGVTISEEDSLFGIGDGHVPSTDATWETAEDYPTQAVVLPFLPFRSPQPEPTEVMSASEPSQSRPSFAVPAESVSHASGLRLEEDIQILIHHPKVKRALSRIPEFSWQDGRLCFDGQPLELPVTRNDQFSRGGPGSEHGFSISQRSLPLEVASAICSVSTDFSLSEYSFKGEFIKADLSPHVEIALQKTIDNIVERLVDDFFRSYAPQKQCLPAKRRLADQSSNTPTKRSRATTTRNGAKAGNRKGQTPDPELIHLSNKSAFWLAPFMKRSPREHRNSCIKKIRDMHGLKKHIREQHFIIHCPKCFMTPPQDASVIPPHPCIETPGLPTRPRLVGFITMEMQTAIKEKPDTRLSRDRIFKITFPQELIPSSPYLDHQMALGLCMAAGAH